MENCDSKHKKVPRMNVFKENVSPVTVKVDSNQFLTARGRNQLSMPAVFDPYAENLDIASPIVRYFRSGSPMAGTTLFPDDAVSSANDSGKSRTASTGSGNSSFGSRGRFSVSPLSPLDNLQRLPSVRSPLVYGTPMKGDDDVLVMDDVQVMSKLGGRNALTFSASSSSSSSSSGKIVLKSEMSDSGFSRSKCKAASGKEDLRSAHHSAKNKAGGQRISKSSASTVGGSSSKNRFATGLKRAVLAMEGKAMMTPPGPTHDPLCASKVLDSPVTLRSWLPQDDGIEFVLPHSPNNKTPSREDVETYIQGVLYPDNNKKRLSAFASFCPI